MTLKQRVWRDKNGKPTTDQKQAVSMLYPEGTELTDAQAKALSDAGIDPEAAGYRRSGPVVQSIAATAEPTPEEKAKKSVDVEDKARKSTGGTK